MEHKANTKHTKEKNVTRFSSSWPSYWLGAVGLDWPNIFNGLHHEETDDAQVSADISPVIPRVSGYVKDQGG